MNPLKDWFYNHTKGRGVWKHEHYLDIYHKHFQEYVGKKVKLLEIGVFNGGSLDMWRHYFGPECEITGVDINPECKRFESEDKKIIIGDQSSKEFWEKFNEENGGFDIIIDDGSHRPEHQKISAECLIPKMNPGGVYLCEDILESDNPEIKWAGSSSYFSSLVRPLNEWNEERELTEFQKRIESISFYVYMVFLKIRKEPIKMKPMKMGDEWELSIKY